MFLVNKHGLWILGALAFSLTVCSVAHAEAAATTFGVQVNVTGKADRDLLDSPMALYEKEGAPEELINTSIEYEGRVDRFALRLDRVGRFYAMRFLAERAEVVIDGVRSGQASANLMRTDGVWLGVQTDRGGTVIGLWFDIGVDETSRNLMRSVVSELQFTSPRFAAMAWQAKEVRPDGEWEVLYAARDRALRGHTSPIFEPIESVFEGLHPASQSDQNEVRRTHITHHDPDRWSPNTHLLTEAKERQGHTTFNLDSHGIKSVDSDITRRHIFGHREGSRTRVALKAVRVGKPQRGAPEFKSNIERLMRTIRQEERGHIWTYDLSEADRVRIARRTLAGQTVESAVLPLRKGEPRSEAWVKESLKSRQLLEAAFIIDDKNVAEAKGLLLSKDISIELTAVLARSLSAASTPGSQAALLSTLAKRLGEEDAALILLDSLAECPRPVEANLDMLLALSADAPSSGIMEAAQLSLGTLASTLRVTNPEWATMIAAGLEAQFGAAEDAAAKEQVLLVMGNAGLQANLPTLKDAYHSSGATKLRAAAVDAMRSIQSNEVDVILNGALVQTGAPILVETAAKVVGFRPFWGKGLEAQLRALTTSQNPVTTRALLLSVWRGRHDHPSIIAAIGQVAQTHKDPDMQAFAKELVANYQAAPTTPKRIMLD